MHVDEVHQSCTTITLKMSMSKGAHFGTNTALRKNCLLFLSFLYSGTYKFKICYQNLIPFSRSPDALNFFLARKSSRSLKIKLYLRPVTIFFTIKKSQHQMALFCTYFTVYFSQILSSSVTKFQFHDKNVHFLNVHDYKLVFQVICIR